MAIETRMGIVRNGKAVVPFEYERIEPAKVDGEESDVIFKFKKDGREGILVYDTYKECYSYTTDENIVFIGDFEDDVAIITVVLVGGTTRCDLIDTKLNRKTNLEYSHINRIGKGYFLACKQQTTDIINSLGDVLFENVIPAIENGKKSNNAFISEKDGLLALIKIDGDTTYETDYDFSTIGTFNSNVSPVTVLYDFGLRYGLLDLKFNELLEPIYSQITMFDSDLYIVRDKEKYGVYSVTKKQMIIPVKFKSVSISSCGYKKTRISVEI